MGTGAGEAESSGRCARAFGAEISGYAGATRRSCRALGRENPPFHVGTQKDGSTIQRSRNRTFDLPAPFLRPALVRSIWGPALAVGPRPETIPVSIAKPLQSQP